MRKIILASTSNSRKMLLERIGLTFEVVDSLVDESQISSDDLKELVQKLAELKAKAVAQKFPDAIVIAGDTMVDLDGEQIGKPTDKADAFRILKKLQGRKHAIHSGLCVIDGEDIQSLVESTILTMIPLSDSEINEYIDSFEPMNKAGAYSITGLGARYFSRVEGDYSSIVGLPLFTLYQILVKKEGVTFKNDKIQP